MVGDLQAAHEPMSVHCFFAFEELVLSRAAKKVVQCRTAHKQCQRVSHLACHGQSGACKTSSASRNSGNIINRADQFGGTHTL